jgi:PAS domain S-box-containing protein
MAAGEAMRSAKTGGAPLQATILRLVRGARERRAIRAGQIDAIIDPATGRAMLLPEAQAALLESKTRLRSLLNLSADGYWEQDEQFCFTEHSGLAIAGPEGVLGRHLWDLPFENSDEIDWQTHRTQLEWRAIVRDLKLRFVDGAGRTRHVSISGEPMFDAAGQFKGYCGIVRDSDTSGEPEITARTDGQFAVAALDALAMPVCALDATGRIALANAAWRRLVSHAQADDAGMAEGGQFLAQRDQFIGDERVDHDATAAGVRQVLAGERELFRYPHFYGSSAGEHWAMASVMPLDANTAGGALVVFEELADARQAGQFASLEYSVARILAGAGTIAAALQSVLRAVCDVQHWDRGRYLRLDAPTSQLVFEQSWGEPAAAVERLREASPQAISGHGSGLAGRACQERRPQWVLDAVRDKQAARKALARESDLGGAFVFPVLAGGQAMGVLAFASRTIRAPDDHLLQAVRSIGEQVGQFLVRRRADDAIRLAEAQCRSLLELSVDWVWEQDEQYRYTRMDGAGMACIKGVLGRTLWELPGIAMADDDSWIKHRSEIEAQWSFCDLECTVTSAEGQLNRYLISGAPTYSEAGVFTGFHGTGLDAPLRPG